MNTDIQRNLLIVKSNDKLTGISENFIYGLGDVSLDINSIALKSACIPHTYTNVNKNNNKLQIETGAEFTLTTSAEANVQVNGVTTIPVAAGTYTLNSLISTLNANQVFGEFTYDSVSNRVTFTIISAGVNTAGVTFLTGGSPEIIGLLGFTLPVNCPTGVGSNITATNAPTYVNNVITDLVVPPAQYTSTTLLAEVVTLIQPHITGTIVGTITTDGKAEFTGATQSWRFNPSPIAGLIGIDTSITTFVTSPLLGTNLFDLYGTRNLYIASNTLSNGYNALEANGVKSSILGEVPVCSSQGGIDKWQQQYLVKKSYPRPINVTNFDIQILDDEGLPIPLGGAEVVLVFEVWAAVKL